MYHIVFEDCIRIILYVHSKASNTSNICIWIIYIIGKYACTYRVLAYNFELKVEKGGHPEQVLSNSACHAFGMHEKQRMVVVRFSNALIEFTMKIRNSYFSCEPNEIKSLLLVCYSYMQCDCRVDKRTRYLFDFY